jgi:hypothetical protein
MNIDWIGPVSLIVLWVLLTAVVLVFVALVLVALWKGAMKSFNKPKGGDDK